MVTFIFTLRSAFSTQFSKQHIAEKIWSYRSDSSSFFTAAKTWLQSVSFAIISFTEKSQKKSPEIHTHLSRRTRATLPQIELPLTEGKTNLEDAFSTLADVSDKNILLLHDVMTYGAKLNAAARCVKEEGTGIAWALVFYRKMWGSQN